MIMSFKAGRHEPPSRKEQDMWIYRAYDKDGFPVAEAYNKADLIKKLTEEFPFKDIKKEFTIKRIFEKWLR